MTASSPPPLPRRSLHGSTNEGMPYLTHDDLHRFVTNNQKHAANKPHTDNHHANNPQQMKDRWISISQDVEYLPVARSLQNNNNDNTNTDNGEASSASGAHATYDPYSVQPFIQGMSDYDEYQQAWRLLGFMIDCNDVIYDDDYQQSRGGSNDGEITEEGCARYVLWAAYVDTEYEGGGIGEYRYWKGENGEGSWDDSACYYAEGGGSGSRDNNDDNNDDNNGNNKGYKSRCAKMDCHLEDTTFSLLGFFKHRNYDDWMEQLFKHEGMCVWTDEQYAFMKNARKAWPSGCADTGATIAYGEEGQTTALYYNIKPSRNGRIAVGLYTDTQCVVDHPADTETVESIVGNIFQNANSHDSGDGTYDFSGDTLAESMDRWDSAFDVWRVCHPCVAHDLENVNGTKYLDDDDDYYWWYNRRGERKLGGEYNAQGDTFECYDDAGYTNVNQCMKFSAKTVMKTATFRDLSLGRHQGTLAENPLSGYLDSRAAYRSHKMGNVATHFFLVVASIGFVFSIVNLFRVARRARRSNVARDVGSDSPLV